MSTSPEDGGATAVHVGTVGNGASTPSRKPSLPGTPSGVQSGPLNGGCMIQVDRLIEEQRRSSGSKLTAANKGVDGTFSRTESKRSARSIASCPSSQQAWQGGEKGPRNSKFRILQAADAQCAIVALQENQESRSHRLRVMLRFTCGQIQKYSMPLILGVVLALILKNVDENGYHSFVDGAIVKDASILGADLHGLSLHFIVNDIFMCFFFGLAIKEVTEALLPGGSLYPLKMAVNPLLATLGGVVGPAVGYVFLTLLLFAVGAFDGMTCKAPLLVAGGGGHRRLAGGSGSVVYGPSEPCSLGTVVKGWGVPTARTSRSLGCSPC